MTTMTCVLRNVAGISQYVPVSEVFQFEHKERSFTGTFRIEVEYDGPSKSHKRTICLPESNLQVRALSQQDVSRLTEEAFASLKK